LLVTNRGVADHQTQGGVLQWCTQEAERLVPLSILGRKNSGGTYGEKFFGGQKDFTKEMGFLKKFLLAPLVS
jgi:hypothetical protein